MHSEFSLKNGGNGTNNTRKKRHLQRNKKKEAAINSRALHGKFTAVVYRGFYRGKAYHGYTVVAIYHIPYRQKTVQFTGNRTKSTIYTISYRRSICRKPYKYVPYTVLNRRILQQPYTVPYTYHGHKQKSTAVIHPQ